jgi:phage shock protein B
MEDLPKVIVLLGLFIGLPWMIFHYITKWKTAATLTRDDESLLEELHDLARRLDERVATVERIVAADNPDWRELGCEPAAPSIENRTDTLRRIK